MAIIKLKPNTPGQRGMVRLVNPELHKGRPKKELVERKATRTSGRNNAGRCTVRHRGGGHKRLLRNVDFKRDKDDIPAQVVRFEYDPGRTANLALLVYADGEYRYILAAKNLRQGATLLSGAKAPIEVGNTLPLTLIPLGQTVHAIEKKVGRGAQMARSAGTSAYLMARNNGMAILRLRSGVIYRVPENCRATIGEVGNAEHGLVRLGKAGRKRHMGIRPTVRGVAMNPVDHPLGGGEGRTSGGRHPCNRNGLVDGKKTRKKNHRTNRFIVKGRVRGSKKRGN